MELIATELLEKDGDESERSQTGDLGLKIDIKATDETAGIRIRGTEASEIPAD